jgi:cytochrome c biogenesis protein
MERRHRTRSPERFISQRFAVTVIAILLGASAAGWLATELVPPDFLERTDTYAERWGGATVRFISLLRLYDPFHSFWYRMVLGLFAIVLLLCIATRWRQFIVRSFRPEPPAGADELRGREFSAEFSWRSLFGGERGARDPLIRFGELYGKKEAIDSETLKREFSRISSFFRRRRFRVAHSEDERGVAFVASTGRWRSFGNLCFHVGILAVTVGGVVGSVWGWREIVYVREGATVSLPPDSVLQLRVEDFEIVTTHRMELKEFVSTVAIFDRAGDTLKTGVIKVNRPMKVDGRSIYQSQYYVDQTTFRYARVGYVLRDSIRRGSFDLTPGAEAPIEGTSIVVSAGRFFPDFRMSREGPLSASPVPANPALEVEVKYGDEIERGFLFLYHPDFNKRFAAPIDLSIVHLEPVFYTGLEVSSNPAAPALFLGFSLATLGLALMYLSNPRTIKGVAGRETLIIAGTEYRWKASFGDEFREMTDGLRRAIAASKERG